MIKRFIPVFLSVLILAGILCSCGEKENTENSGTVVTDCAGREVVVPDNPGSICTLCPFSGPVAVMLGYGDRITSTCNNVARSNLLLEICPSLADAVVVKNSGSVNAEEVMNLDTDLIFVDTGVYSSDAERQKLDTMGIPYVVIGFETIEEQLNAVKTIGHALHNEEKAKQYTDWFESAIGLVDESLEGVTYTPSVYHSVNEAARTDAAGSYCAEWISHTKAYNVSTGNESLRFDGEKSYTTLEQIYVWDPEYIICNEAQVDDYILTDSKWEGLSAVINKQVYQIPVGITRWGHPSSIETPLAILWLAELIHPDSVNYDFEEMVSDFYLQFFGFTPDNELLENMMEGDDMRSAKVSNGVN